MPSLRTDWQCQPNRRPIDRTGDKIRAGHHPQGRAKPRLIVPQALIVAADEVIE
jgi:hypothetical protein